MITPHRDVAERYLDYLDREIDLLAAHLPRRRGVSQLHWGGGTPTYYTAEQLERVFARLAPHFTLRAGRRDRRRDRPAGHLGRISSTTLRRLGFNRLSMGVQDFAPEVQEAVNRIQSYEQTRALVDHARALGFRSINIDLIYGLPYQTDDGLPAHARSGRRPASRAGRRLLVRLRARGWPRT